MSPAESITTALHPAGCGEERARVWGLWVNRRKSGQGWQGCRDENGISHSTQGKHKGGDAPRLSTRGSPGNSSSSRKSWQVPTPSQPGDCHTLGAETKVLHGSGVLLSNSCFPKSSLSESGVLGALKFLGLTPGTPTAMWERRAAPGSGWRAWLCPAPVYPGILYGLPGGASTLCQALGWVLSGPVI